MQTPAPPHRNPGDDCHARRQFAWYDKPGTPQPKVWFHDLFHADGRPYDAKEQESIRQTTAGKALDWGTGDRCPPAPQSKPPARVGHSHGS